MVIAIVHGDGYTEFTGGPVDFKHYLATDELVAVVTAALDGRLTYVGRHRFGRLIDSYFEIPEADRRFGADPLNPGRQIAGLPGTDSRIRVTFGDPTVFKPS